MANIAIYGSHNGSIALEDEGKYYVVEFERFFNIKNIGLAQYKPLRYREEAVYAMLQYFEKELGYSAPFDNMIHINTECVHDDVTYSYKDFIQANNVLEGWHHHAHASGSFYQSNFSKALIFSFDGGGNDGFFNIFTADRDTGVTYLDKTNPADRTDYDYDFGFPYMCFAHFCPDIRQEWISDGNLVYSGKIMGLCNFGKCREEWLPYFKEFYYAKPDGENYITKLETIIGKNCNLVFDENNRLEKEISWDVAATSQQAFEECFFEVANPYLEKYKDLPIIITGGCGLNILLCTKIKQNFPERESFVAPNTNDCGIAVGLLAGFKKPKTPIDITYGGMELLDKNTYPAWIESNVAKPINLNLISDELAEGKIFGVARGRSEHGPRALGNRSIICNPAFPEMKDILNQKVKNREWYRPFAPVVRLEDVSEYFEWEHESKHMLYCPKVRKKWRKKLSSITHIDGTARVQTVTREQNEFLYDLLTIFKEKAGHGVLLNTSFNIAGKPILNTIAAAVKVLEKTQMDYLIIEDFWYGKHW